MTQDRRIAIEQSIAKASQQFNMERAEKSAEVYACLAAGLRPFTVAVSLAQTLAVFVAERSDSSEVTPVHLLFGLLFPPSGVAARLLELSGVPVQEFKNEIMTMMGYHRGDWEQKGVLRMQTSSETTALLPMVQACRLQTGEPYVHTGHLFLGIMDLYRTHDTRPAWMTSRPLDLMTVKDLEGIKGEA